MPSLLFPKQIRPYMNVFSQAVSGLLAWRLMDPITVEAAFGRLTAEDVPLASVVLARDRQHIAFSGKKAIARLVRGDIDHHRHLSVLAQQVLGHCWEVMRMEKPFPTNDPAVQFYRHVRNGCFHGNHLHFERGEPRRAATWRGLSIVNTMQGAKIFRDGMRDRQYFLNWGDAVLLLSDVSQLVYLSGP